MISKIQTTRQRGIALIIVLWTMALLAIVAGSFAFAMRQEVMATQNIVAAAQARWLANGAVERAVFELVVPRVEQDAAWKAEGRVYTWEEDQATISVSIVDEGAFIDLNTAHEEILRRLFHFVGGLDEIEAAKMVDVVIDWRDADDFKRPNGAEKADYKSAKKDYAPPNAPFQSVEELGLALGMTPSLYAAVSPHLTVYSRQPSVNTATASREVLLCLPNATEEMVNDFLARRAQAIASRLPVPGFPGGGARTSIWRITADVEMKEEETQFTRVAVLRYTGQNKAPLSVLLWTEG
ncbi:MAG: general secretion pathway protein GspK [Burkholderiales bacterium]|jgi:general secretion pathway protein K|nr:general secretion pathway protein GspK [Burkholderiales bacterium]